MNLGGRRARTPSTPPIPVPPPPPSAYGLSVPGAPAAPSFPPPPAPPQQSAPPAQPYQPPTPPADGSGFFGGPVASSAAAPSQFASYGQSAPPPQSQFGSYGQSAPAPQFGGFGQPAGVPYGAPSWGQPAPAAKTGKQLGVKASVGAVVVFLGFGFFLNGYDRATAHTIGALPVAVGAMQRVETPDLDQRVNDAVTKAEGSYGMHGVQAGFYEASGQRLFAMVADVPAGVQRHKDTFFRGMTKGTDGVVFTPVSAGPKGGSAACGALATAELCAWIDNGTTGMVVVAADQQTAAADLLEVRASAES